MKNIFKYFKILTLCLFAFFCKTSNLTAQNILSDSIVNQRLLTIEQTLKLDYKNSKIWWNTWLYGYSSATIVQGFLAKSEDLSTRQDMILGASTTFLGAMAQLVTPIESKKTMTAFFLLPENTQEERLYKLKEAEKILEKSALREKFGRSWQTQTLFAAANVGGGLITWFGFKRNVWAGLGYFALNTALCEIQLYTQPMRSAKLYDRLISENNFSYSNFKQQKMFWSANLFPGGIKLCLSF